MLLILRSKDILLRFKKKSFNFFTEMNLFSLYFFWPQHIGCFKVPEIYVFFVILQNERENVDLLGTELLY